MCNVFIKAYSGHWLNQSDLVYTKNQFYYRYAEKLLELYMESRSNSKQQVSIDALIFS